MIALDTNMLVRALVADHPDQVAVVRQLMESDTVFMFPHRAAGNRMGAARPLQAKAPAELLAFFQALLETDDTVIEAAEEVRNALDWYGHGADFADALHLAACGSAVMHTFDRDFCAAALAAGIAPEVRIWEV
jgi:predicted nucleic acid-binding protein